MDKKNWMPESADDSAKRPAAGNADAGLQDAKRSTSTFWNKRNLAVIIGMLVIVLAMVVAVILIPRPKADEDMVVIKVAGKEYARIPLSQPQKLTISQENGAVNVVEVTENGMRMVSSTCDNQICVNRGMVTLDTWDQMVNGPIYCSPNKVELSLVKKDETVAAGPVESKQPEKTSPVRPAETEPVRNTQKTTGSGWYFDTLVSITLYGAPDGTMEDIWALCKRYENLLSKTVEGSDVSRINAANGETVTVDPETWEILRRAREISAVSDGAFSITIAPLSAMWDFTRGTKRMPTEEERLAALPLVDDSAIVLGENYTVTLPAGVQIDLGGIAKGYIADKMAEMLRGRVMGAIISLGGNTYVVGDKPDGSQNVIGVQDPFSMTGTVAGVIFTKNVSIVTSGTYERGFRGDDGVWYHHILDPKTGLPAQSDLVSATLVMTSSMDADALATAFIVLGSEKALALAAELGVDAVLIRDNGEFLFTEGFVEKYGYMTYEAFLNR